MAAGSGMAARSSMAAVRAVLSAVRVGWCEGLLLVVVRGRGLLLLLPLLGVRGLRGLLPPLLAPRWRLKRAGAERGQPVLLAHRRLVRGLEGRRAHCLLRHSHQIAMRSGPVRTHAVGVARAD
jgi:hypothetical protein